MRLYLIPTQTAVVTLQFLSPADAWDATLPVVERTVQTVQVLP
jgi:hypothetical protein